MRHWGSDFQTGTGRVKTQIQKPPIRKNQTRKTRRGVQSLGHLCNKSSVPIPVTVPRITRLVPALVSAPALGFSGFWRRDFRPRALSCSGERKSKRGEKCAGKGEELFRKRSHGTESIIGIANLTPPFRGVLSHRLTTALRCVARASRGAPPHDQGHGPVSNLSRCTGRQSKFLAACRSGEFNPRSPMGRRIPRKWQFSYGADGFLGTLWRALATRLRETALGDLHVPPDRPVTHPTARNPVETGP